MDDIYYKNTGIRIINNDILKTKTIPDNSIDLIVTSPPYNLDIGYESYNDGLDYQEYLKLCSKEFLQYRENPVFIAFCQAHVI